MQLMRIPLITLGCALAAVTARAQTLEIKPGNFNSLYIAPATAPVGSNQATFPPTAGSNFAGVGGSAAADGPVDVSAVHGDRYPSNTGNTQVVTKSTFGGAFGTGAPLFSLGDEITPPLTKEDGTSFAGTDAEKLVAARAYWRAQPVLPGENLPGAGGILIPLGSVTVTASDANRTVVTISLSPAPVLLDVGASLLGQPIIKIAGTTVTLAGNANETITGAVTRPITPATDFYYSPHADRVYASQPGQVAIKWVNRDLIANGTHAPATVIKPQDFVVDANPKRPVRRIYWTEGSFDGPKVQITDARITTIAPAFNRSVPKSVVEEVSIPGYTPIMPNLTTLSFDRFNGIGQLHAHNVEGRVLIEYLGNARLGNIHDSLGTDVVEIVRQPEVNLVSQNLGAEIRPRWPAQAGDDRLVASPALTNTQQGGTTYYGTSSRPDGTLAYYAERATSAANDPDNGQPVSSEAYNKVVFYWMETFPDNFGILWPKFQSRYWQRWSPNLSDYAHYTVDTTGSTAETGLTFPGGSLPTIVFQDDPAQTEAQMDVNSQRLFVSFAPTNPQRRNRSLLKFTGSQSLWYVNLYSQAESRKTTRDVDTFPGYPWARFVEGTTAGLEVGMTVTGEGILGGAATVVRIFDSESFELSSPAWFSSDTFTFTVESDGGAPINTSATVGSRIQPPLGHEFAGYISGGTAYYPGGYLNPFATGVEEANRGAIIPVNAQPGNDLLTVRWFKKIAAPGSGFSDFYVPGKIGRYTIGYPASTDPRIVIAQGVGTGDLDPEVIAGTLYYQNNPAQPGYNPNEEHAVKIGTRAYALRDDLNMIAPQQSQPFVLIAYTHPADQRPAMKVYKVVREVDDDGDRADPFDILFDRPAVAGTELVAPYPLPLMDLPFDATGVCQNQEVTPVTGQDPRVNTAGTPVDWNSFTMKDRKGYHWVYRGPHDGVSTSKRISMQYKYVSRPGFFLPAAGGTGTEIAPGTLLPFLRPLTAGVPQGDPVTGTPLAINFIPRWPALAAELRVGETLTLPKFGLPQVRGQLSANVFYQQSLALATANPSVTLHDPTREKTARLEAAGLERLPGSIATTSYLGKVFFQRLSPDLQQRIWFDPLRGGGTAAGGQQLKPGLMVLVGEFKDEIAGEDYLHLNVLTERQIAELKALCTETGAIKTKWDSLIDGLSTKVETYIENPNRRGTYIVDDPRTVNVGEDQLAKITDSDTAVDSYALTATGEGAGWVTMIFGNGEAFTPEGDPVLVKVFKVAPTLYTGELKPIYSKNPLDEQVTLRHTGDFAARPQDYEFEWKWAAGSATAPAIYTTSWTNQIGGTNNQWSVLRNPSESDITGGSGSATGFARSVPVTGGDPGEGLDLSGNFRYAFTVGASYDRVFLNPGWSVAGDAYFTQDNAPGITVTAQHEIESWYGLGSIPQTLADEVINAVYQSIRWTSAPQPITVDLAGLTPGGRYKLQLLFGDFISNRVFDIYAEDLKIMESFYPALARGGLGNIAGAAVVYEFTATDAVLNIVLDGSTVSDPGVIDRNPILNGVTLEEVTASSSPVLPFPRSIAVNDADHPLDAGDRPDSSLPGLLLTKTDSLDFTGGVPGEIAFSARLGELDGFVLYINDAAALAYHAPDGFTNTDALSALVPGNTLPLQFRVPRSFFRAGTNTVKIAVFSKADANAANQMDFRLDVTREQDVTATTFQPVSDPLPNQKNTNVALIGGDPSLPFGSSTFVLNDRWFTMRYRPRPGVTNVAGTGWSRWMPPQFVEGWIKRVLREINPFEQRVKDMFNNSISTDTSVLTQAGTRWEGDIALTLDNLESVGLIAIYETVLNRARSMSIDANTNDPDTNNALMLAAGYLSDLYTLLGHEAYADAANPTISTDDANDTIEINTSRYSFENQVANSLDEELALLRGRDASGTRVDVSPAYNRLYWNYTGGINAGEAIYATNYNIKEKAGSSTADGVIDAADAQRMFPQGHGDAYGHYLTALTGYYRLLANPNFSWQRRAEAVLVLGQAVTVDFVDERKFAGDASFLAQAAQQICALTYRQQYTEGAAGWSHYRDTATAPNTTEKRNWGLDEWISRSAQGAYYHWVVGNAMLPDADTYHTGVEKIDRTTVPELNELATALESFQTTADNASARLNPLGISPGAIQFDIDSTFLEVGSTAGIGDNAVQGMGHFDQIRERAMKTLSNAAGAFQQAARMTRSLRNQENQVDDYNSLIVDQERTFRNQLIEIYGRPYEGAVGPGKQYPQGYYGPDLRQWFVVDRPNDLVDTTSKDTVKFRIWMVPDREFNVPHLDAAGLIADYDVYQENGQTIRQEIEVTAYPNQFIQYSDTFLPGLGRRPETGELQAALLDAHRAFLVVKDGLYNVKVLQHRFLHEGNLLLEAIQAHQQHLTAQDATQESIVIMLSLQKTLETVANAADVVAEGAQKAGDAAGEFLPKVVGVANDVTSTARASFKSAAGTAWIISKAVSVVSRYSASSMDVGIADQEMSLERRLDAIGFSLEEKQQAYELESLYRELTTQEYALAHPLAAYQAANERVASILGRGQRIEEERLAFRRRAAAVVQGYRTKDVTFRVFRNEALEQYRSLFDLASRYTYMAAKAYDYETGLLGTMEGQAFISSIVSSRSLGDIRDGEVFATVSSLGDNGLAGAMAKMHADHRVAEGRLGINNPEIYSTLFSMRGENFRILDDPNSTADDEAWRQTLEQYYVANLLADSDVAALCRNVKRPDGRPVPGIILPFSTTIQHGLNFFGLPLAAGDHTFSATNFSTKIQSLGIALPGYVGMDEYANGDPNGGTPALADPNALSATPYLYVIPTGTDYMYAPPLGNELFERSWKVEDQAMPLPFNIGANEFNNMQFFNANGTLTEKPWIIRQHQAFRPVADPAILLGDLPTEFTSHRLAARSVWNSGWKIVIPAYTLLNDEQEGLNRFARTVRDIRIFIRSYSYSGN